jgi:hypothetical protein
MRSGDHPGTPWGLDAAHCSLLTRRSALVDERCDDTEVVGQAGSGEVPYLLRNGCDNFPRGVPLERLDALSEPRCAELLAVVASFGDPTGIRRTPSPGERW